jgi:(p)ppGpp synthase/HD superfamily hydrolase
MSARDYAIQYHWGQKYGDKPYIFHLDEVANTIKGMDIRYNKRLLIEVAYLHDIIEDTEVSYDMLKAGFGVDTANAVYALTNSDIPLREKLLCNHTAMKVKLIDRYCNVKNCIKDNKAKLLTKYKNQEDLFLKGDFKEESCIDKFKELGFMLRRGKLK